MFIRKIHIKTVSQIKKTLDLDALNDPNESTTTYNEEDSFLRIMNLALIKFSSYCIVLYCIELFCFDGMVIAAQCTVTF